VGQQLCTLAFGGVLPDPRRGDFLLWHRTRHLLNQEFMQALLLHFRQASSNVTSFNKKAG